MFRANTSSGEISPNSVYRKTAHNNLSTPTWLYHDENLSEVNCSASFFLQTDPKVYRKEYGCGCTF